MNTGVTTEQAQALASAFKYNKHDINEVCFVNNNITDK